jgi:cobalt-zinc-cadmium efflux system protein
LRRAFILTAFAALLELGGGILAHSLALLADSAHVFMDVAALAIAWTAQRQAERPATHRQTFGFARMEVLAALANAGLLSAVTLLIVVEAVHRFAAPALPSGSVMIGVAGLAAAVNICTGWTLAREAGENLNARAALYHVAADVFGTIAVFIGGIVILARGILWVDPVLSLFVALFVFVGVAHIVTEAANILLEGTPRHIDLPALATAMTAIEGVAGVHDLHVWTIGTHRHALCAHVLVPDERISACTGILREIEARLRRDFAVTHVTVQFECESCGEDKRIVCIHW